MMEVDKNLTSNNVYVAKAGSVLNQRSVSAAADQYQTESVVAFNPLLLINAKR
jgi:hypothetical protein